MTYHPEKMPDPRFTENPISQAEIARQKMELDDHNRRAQMIGQEALEASAGEMKILLDLLKLTDDPSSNKE